MARRPGPQRGQRAATTSPTDIAMHRHDTSFEVLTQAIVRYAIDRVRLDPPPLDGPRTLVELRAMAGQTHHGAGPRRAGGAAGVRRGARPGVHLRRPPPVPVVRPGRADRRVDPVRPRRRGVQHLRRVVARGRRRGVRRERGAALDRRPGRDARRRRRGVRQRRDGRQPQRADRGALPVARARRRRPRPHPRPAADVGGGPLVGRPGGAGDGRRRGQRAGRRPGPAAGARRCGRRSTA